MIVIELLVCSRPNPSTAAIWELKGHARILAFIGEHLRVRRTLRQQRHESFTVIIAAALSERP
jgi:hypothetical protein